MKPAPKAATPVKLNMYSAQERMYKLHVTAYGVWLGFWVSHFQDNGTFTYRLMCKPVSESVPTVGKGKGKGKVHPRTGHEGPGRITLLFL
jgi:hypothetical protein